MTDESKNHSLINPKQEYVKNLYAKFTLAYQQLSETRNQDDKPSIEATIKRLQLEIEQVEAEIEELKLRTLSKNSSELHRKQQKRWEEKFPKIDFRETNKMLTSILGQFEEREGAALFLLQNSHSMCGDLCIENIKLQLQDMGNWYPPCEFEFPSHQTVDRIHFLDYLARKFDIEISLDEIPKYTDRIIDKICASLRGGDIFFIKIDIDNVDYQDTFLDWFLHQFWCTLITRLPQLSQKQPLIRFVAVVSISGSIPKDFLLSDLCCKKNKFDSKKFLELPLQKTWTQPQINNWLLKFSGITAPPVELSKEEIEMLAGNIYRSTNGRPCEVYNQLIIKMSKLVN